MVSVTLQQCLQQATQLTAPQVTVTRQVIHELALSLVTLVLSLSTTAALLKFVVLWTHSFDTISATPILFHSASFDPVVRQPGPGLAAH